MAKPLDVYIRRARPSDKRAVREIARTIWGGDDYVPEVFDDWVKDRRGGLWLAIVGDRPVGVARLTLLGDREAWLHALRVHPRWRRRGVARVLIAFRLDRAKRLGARIARLDTADDNAPVHQLTRRFGFRRVARYAFWRKPARAGRIPRQANGSELAALWRLARGADLLLHGEFERRILSRDDLARATRAGRCLVVGHLGEPAAMALVEPRVEGLRLRYLAGSGRALRELLSVLPAEASRRGKERVGVTASPALWRALRAARFRRPWSGEMHVFEKRL